MSPFKPTHLSHKQVEAYPLIRLKLDEQDERGLIAVVDVAGEQREILVPASITARGTPEPGSMLVRYEPNEREPDGYFSFSPRAPFDAGYSAIVPAEHRKSYEGGGRGLTFGQAIEQAKDGAAIARDGWNGKNMFVVLMPPLLLPPFNTQDTARKVNDRTAKWIGEDQPLDCLPYFAMYTAAKQWQPGWVASQADMLADDWCVVQGAAQSLSA